MSKLAHSNQQTMDQIEAAGRERRGECVIEMHVDPYLKGDNYYCSACGIGMGHAYYKVRRELDAIKATTAPIEPKKYLLCDPRASTMTDGHRHMQESSVGNWVEAKDYQALNQYVQRLVDRLKDPTQEMVDAGMAVIHNYDAHQTFTAMFARLLREIRDESSSN